MIYNLNIVFHVKLYILFTVEAKFLKLFLIILNNDPEKKIIENNYG